VLSFGVGCAGGDDRTDVGDLDVDHSVEIISWWTGPGEVEALRALIGVHEDQNPESSVTDAATESGRDARELIAERFLEGNPPDVFQENVPDIPQFLQDNPGGLVPLDDLFEEQGWADDIWPEVMERITVDGHIYAMPVGVHRENSLIYNRALFDEHELSPPTSLEELWEVCDAFKDAGVTPLATGGEGWILRLMFHSIALSTMGGADYEVYFAGKGDRDDPELVAAIRNFDRILESYVGEGMLAEDFGWQDAARAVHGGDAAMYFHGDWAAGYLQALGWKAGTDYGVVGSPGASEVFLLGVDAFAVPAEASNMDGALEFLKTVGSEEGQVAFNNIKGSTPVRMDIAESDLSEVARNTHGDLSSAEIIINAPSWDDLDDAILAFSLSGDEEALVKYFQDTIYP